VQTVTRANNSQLLYTTHLKWEAV